MDSIRVVRDTIRGLPGLDAYGVGFYDSIAVEGWLGTSRPTFLVVSGAEPEGGDYVGPVLTIVRPGEKLTWGVNGTPHPEYPGELTSRFDSLILQSRAFVGQCADSGRALVEFIRYRSGRKAPWRDSTHTYAARDDALLSVSNDAALRLDTVLHHVSEGRCREIKPIAHNTASDEEPPDDST
jgi:hypothetical protein